MIYVPDTSYSCYVLVNKDTIRAYSQTPYNPGYNQSVNINYRDYYINSNYLYVDSYQTFNNYSQLPVCLDISNLTDEVYYRNDFASILIIFTIMAFFIIYLPLKVFFRLFKKGGL